MNAPNPRLFEPFETRFSGQMQQGEYFDPRHATEITLRDLFAAAALAGLCANPGLLETELTTQQYRDSFAASAFKAADAMLRARSVSPDQSAPTTGGKA